jgi:hypothetical protein
MKIGKTVHLFLAILLVFSVNAFGQGDTAASNVSMPFGPGETLTYEAKYNKIIKLGIPVADMTFTVTRDEDTGNLILNGVAKSKGTLLKIFRFSFLQTVGSTVEPGNFTTLKTVKHDVQKERIRDSEAVFDYENDTVTFIETDPNDLSRPPRSIASQITPDVRDILSGLYSLRFQPLEVGKEFTVTVSDSGLVYEIPVKVAEREEQKTIFGKVMCLRLEPQMFGEGRLIGGDGSMKIWITDDARRVPVRSEVKASVGEFEIKLQKAENLMKIDGQPQTVTESDPDTN